VTVAVVRVAGKVSYGGLNGGYGLLGFEHSRVFLNVLDFFVIFWWFDRKNREREKGNLFLMSWQRMISDVDH
jgi:hypothetical protein